MSLEDTEDNRDTNLDIEDSLNQELRAFLQAYFQEHQAFLQGHLAFHTTLLEQWKAYLPFQ